MTKLPTNSSSPSDSSKTDIAFLTLVENSEAMKVLRRELAVATRLSLTGITNLIVKHEDPCIIDEFLKSCFKRKMLYRETHNIDAVELQRGRPGQGFSSTYLDALIFGAIETEKTESGMASVPKTDPQTGARKRKMSGFVSRKEVIQGTKCDDRLLIIRNIDYCMDFCSVEPGFVDARSLWIFDNFRNPTVRKKCRLLLITNKKLVLPFEIRTIYFPMVNDFEADHIIRSFTDLYTKGQYTIKFNDTQRTQVARKLRGLTYTRAADALASAMSRSEYPSKVIDADRVVRQLRENINKSLMEDASGLTHLSPKPWDDYICPESSNFTFDVEKILRDFEEIRFLKDQREAIVRAGEDDKLISRNIDAIQTRMPHVILLYGRGGVGKSAFPLHFAGLVDLDVWDFNVNASHSKWVGEGAERMRESLKKISSASHLVVRIDEYDRAIGATNSAGQGMHEAHKQVESEFMNWLQNSQEENLFVRNNIFLVLTTNHKDNLTGPLLRSGRVDLVIDIANFDATSMKEAFLSAPRRMEHRGINVVGFDSKDAFLSAIEKLDVDQLAELATIKGFTVRDIDTILVEMAAHNYYHKRGKSKLYWSTECFVNVLENSVGSAKNGETNELTLGDRYVDVNPQDVDGQMQFEFFELISPEFDLEEFKRIQFE